MDTVTAGRLRKKVIKKKTKGKAFLPDDIIPNILCRLPATNASQCRLVCKGWRDLTSTRDFVDLHFLHSFPMIMVANPGRCYPKVDYFLLDKWWETTRMKLMIHRFTTDHQKCHLEYKPLFSHSGLIVFKESVLLPDVVILNPINHEKVTISVSRGLNICDFFGVFFHPSLKEYCTLWRIEVSLSHHATEGQLIGIFYKILILGSNPLLKTISNPFAHRHKRYDRYPLLIDKYLYWMLESEEIQDYKYSGGKDIMQFDIIGEEFSVKPCPVPVDTECKPTQTHILNIDGALSFLVIFPTKITIWRLKDHTGQLWTETNYTFSTANFCNTTIPVAVMDGNLALLCDRRLLVCDLMHGTVKCFRKQRYHSGVLFLSHQVSLASLSNCQSTIYLDEKGEVSNSQPSDSSDSFGWDWESPYNVNFEISSSDEDVMILPYDEL